MRSGIIAQKVGMTRLYTDEGGHVPVTVLKVDDCEVLAVRTKEKDGYVAVQLGAGKAKEKRVAQPQRVQYAKANVTPKKTVMEFRVSDDCVIPVGSQLSVNHFIKGQFVDVTGISLGKGFAGVMKRYNFSGDNATHGVSGTHRSAGSTGQRQDPGRVFKNQKMPGHMGAEQVTVQNLQVVALDEENGLIMVKGAVPGFDGTTIIVKDAVKKALPKEAPIPAGLKTKEQPAAEAKAEAVEQAPVEEQPVAETPAETTEQAQAEEAVAATDKE